MRAVWRLMVHMGWTPAQVRALPPADLAWCLTMAALDPPEAPAL
jgi:hypothetical protein